MMTRRGKFSKNIHAGVDLLVKKRPGSWHVEHVRNVRRKFSIAMRGLTRVEPERSEGEQANERLERITDWNMNSPHRKLPSKVSSHTIKSKMRSRQMFFSLSLCHHQIYSETLLPTLDMAKNIDSASESAASNVPYTLGEIEQDCDICSCFSYRFNPNSLDMKIKDRPTGRDD